MVRQLRISLLTSFLVLSILMIVPPIASSFAEEQHICRYCNAASYQRKASCRGKTDEGDDTLGLRKYAPARYIDLLHLKLDVTPDFERRTVVGTATLDFTPIAKPLSELKLDAVDLNVTAVRGSAAVADFTVTRQHLTITFAQPLAVGQRYSLEIDYSAEPREGLYFRTPELGYPAGDTHLFTQGEPQLGRHWFPCHDYPNERSTTEIICHVPADMTVLSNGRQVGETVVGGMKTVHWKQEKPHVCYLITLVAGHFAKLEDLDREVPLAFYTQPSVAQYAANSFRDTADIMQFYNQEIGVPFPWHKYFQVTVHDFQFGGMENTSMTTLAHRTIFTAATENIRSGRKLDAHEMAHQWFGDYVTCKDWSHIWLNEGFATYYSRLYEGHKFGREALLYDLYRDANDKVLPEHEDRRPIIYNRYDNPIEQFDFRAYPKGSWVLHMLRSQLGETLYREVVRTYLQRHALTSVTTPDFVKVIEELSGRSLDRFFDQWVYHPRHPSLEVEYEWLAGKKLAHVTVKQTQKVDDQVLLFEFPTTLRFWVGEQTVDFPIKINQKKQDFFVRLAEQPTLVRFDPEYTVLADVEFEKSDKLLFAQLKNERDMIGRILAVRALAERETQAALAAVGEALREDSFFGVRIQAAQSLGKVEKKEAFAELKQSVTAGDARVRLAVIAAIGKFFSRQAEQVLIQVIGQEQNPAIAAEAIRSLGKYRSKAAQAAVHKQLNSHSFRNELVVAAIEATGMQQEPVWSEIVMRAMTAREAGFTSRGLSVSLQALAESGRPRESPNGRKEIEQFLRGFLEHPKKPVRVAAMEALGTLGDSRSLAILESVADEGSNDTLMRAAAKSLKKLQERAPLVPKELTELRNLVGKLHEESKKLREELDALKAEEEAAKGEAMK